MKTFFAIIGYLTLLFATILGLEILHHKLGLNEALQWYFILMTFVIAIGSVYTNEAK